MSKNDELGEASFKRTRSDADFSARKRVKSEKTTSSENLNKKQITEEQDLMRYLDEWVCSISELLFLMNSLLDTVLE
jgi:hypothetical protein